MSPETTWYKFPEGPAYNYRYYKTSIDFRIEHKNYNQTFYSAQLYGTNGERTKGSAHGDRYRFGTAWFTYPFNMFPDGDTAQLPIPMPTSQFERNSEFTLQSLEHIKNLIECEHLTPKRKLAAKQLAHQINLSAFECARLKLLCFVKLFNPEFVVQLNLAHEAIFNLLKQVETTGEVQPLQQLLDPHFAEQLLQQDIGRLNISEQVAQPLTTQVKTMRQQPLRNNAHWRSMTHAYASLEVLEKKLLEAPLLQLQSDMQQIEINIQDCVSHLARQHQDFQDAVQAIQDGLVPHALLGADEHLSELQEEMIDLDEAFSSSLTELDMLDETARAVWRAPVKKPVEITDKKPVQQNHLTNQWQDITKELGFSFSETVENLEKAFSQFQSQVVLQKPGVIFVGETGAGKSVLTNRCLGIDYHKNKKGYAVKTDASQQEFAKTGSSRQSETLFPNFCTTKDTPFTIIDMAGFDDTRGEPVRIANSASLEWLQHSLRSVQGIVMVCPEDDVEDKPGQKFINLRKTLEAVGHMIKNNPQGARQQICLVVTRAKASKEDILSGLNEWWETEFKNKDVSKQSESEQAIHRVLSIITETPDALLLVDVTKPNEHLALMEKINTMPINTNVKEYVFSPKSTDMKLIRQTIEFILAVKEKDEQEIALLQTSLRLKIKHCLNNNRIELGPELLALKGALESMQALGHVNCNVDALLTLIQIQEDFIQWLQEKIDVAVHGLKTNGSLSLVDDADIEDILSAKLEEFTKHHAFFARITELAKKMNLEISPVEAFVSQTIEPHAYDLIESAVHPVDGDGNCFFHAIAWHFKQQNLYPGLTHTMIRAKGIEYLEACLKQDPSLATQWFDEDETAEAYIARMRKEGEYAEGPIISMIARAYQIHLVVYDLRLQKNKDGNLDKLVHVVHENDSPEAKATIDVRLRDQIHYDPLKPDRNAKKTETAKVSVTTISMFEKTSNEDPCSRYNSVVLKI